MLVEKIVPNGVGSARPPANVRPPGAVWQALQLPMAASSAPRLMRAASKLRASVIPIGSIEGRQTSAMRIAAIAARRAATPTRNPRAVMDAPQLEASNGEARALGSQP